MNIDFSKLYIGFDRDGTLEMPGVPMPPELIAQLGELEAKGATLFVASGKSHLQLTEIFAAIHFKPWMICAENGGHMVIQDHPEAFIEGNAHPDLQFFLNALPTLKNLPPHGEEPKRAIWSKKFYERAEEAGEVLRDFIKAHQLKLDVFVYPDGWGGVDVVPQGIDKVNLLKHLPTGAQIHYFGDGENDLGIMRDPRVMPHTMANAKASVKACVQERGGMISNYPAGLGVADILKRLFLE